MEVLQSVKLTLQQENQNFLKWHKADGNNKNTTFISHLMLSFIERDKNRRDIWCFQYFIDFKSQSMLVPEVQDVVDLILQLQLELESSNGCLWTSLMHFHQKYFFPSNNRMYRDMSNFTRAFFSQTHTGNQQSTTIIRTKHIFLPFS